MNTEKKDEKNLSLNIRTFVLLFILFVSFTKAQPLHEYFFNGNFVGTNGGPTLTENLACGAGLGSFGTQTVATVGQTCAVSNVFCWNQGGGIQYANPSYITNQYSINLFFKFNNLGGWSRIIDFSNSTADAGIYLLNDCLNFFPNGNVGPCPNFLPNIYYLFSFVRDGSTNIITVYVNGAFFGSYNDAGNLYRPATNVTPIIFFRDDNPVPCEAKAGCVRYASISSATMTPGQVQTTYTNICNVILPIELSDFNALKNEYTTDLKWTTMSEKGNKAFEVQRSIDGTEFVKIGEVQGSNNSREKKNYSFTDKEPLNGGNYYRLKQIDHDGTFTYSEIKFIAYDKLTAWFYPNPSNSQITFKNLSAGETVLIRSYTGQVVLEEVIGEEKTLRVTDLPEGIYFVNSKDHTGKMIIKR
jgi:hypothetical protein